METKGLACASTHQLSDLENDKSLPSATTLANLSIYTDLNIYWLLTGKGLVYRKLAPDMEKSAEQSCLYEDFMFMMQDRKLKRVVEKVIAVYREGNIKKKAQMQEFLSALS